MATAPAPSRSPFTRLKADSYWSKLAVHKVPARYLMIAAFVSYLIIGIAYLEGAPVWLAMGLGLAPWGAIVFFELEWTFKHFGWFALFSLMAFVQTIHYAEHCIQVLQVHVFGQSLHDSQAIFGSLAREGVHFWGDTFLTVGTLILLKKFPRNPWLWVAIPFQLAHQAEHTYLYFNHVFEGVPAGAAGLLASPGGLIGGGVGLNRPDLHWIYNTLFTVPFALALIYQLKHSYDRALDEAFPEVDSSVLDRAARKLETFRYGPSETVLAPGDDANRLYIITEGTAVVTEHDAEGREVEVATLYTGEYFGETGLLVPSAEHTRTVRAKTDLVVQAMDEQTFREVLASSQQEQLDMTKRAEARLAAGPETAPPATA